MNNVSIILPALDDDENVAKIRPKLLALDFVNEVIVDSTVGLGKAIGEGIKSAGNETVCVMDCDGMHPVEALEQMIYIYQAQEELFDTPLLVSGSRSHWEKSLRGLVSRTGNQLARTLLGLNVRDCTTGFFVGNRNELLKLPVWSGYGDFSIALHHEAKVRGWRVVEALFVYGLRDGGKTHTKVFRHSLQYLLRIWSLSWQR